MTTGPAASSNITDPNRVAALRSLHVVDTPAEERYDRIVETAAALFRVEMAAINFVTEDRQWTKAQTGLDGVTDVPVSESICAHVVEHDALLVIEDAASDARFSHARYLGQGVRFYAGYPLHAPTGEPIGSLCIADTEPRDLSAADRVALQALAGLIEREVAVAGEFDRALEVQQLLLPSAAPSVPGYSIAGRSVPATTIAGDFFAWHVLPDGALQVHLADVMGKGIPAALIAASLRAALLTVSQFNDLGTTMTRVSSAAINVLGNTESFATVFSARLQPESGRIQYLDAGHGLAFIIGVDQHVRQLSSSGLPVGIVPDDTWAVHDDVLLPGETLVVVSDGVLELFPDLENGLERLSQAQRRSAEELVDVTLSYARAQHHQDDVTVIAIERHGLA